MKIKKFFIFCILLIFLISLSGCYDAKSIEDLVYSTAIGLDISENNKLSLTLQFSVPSSSSGEGSSQSSNSQTITIECSSINSGLSLINSYISKDVNLSHCKVIVISEELAQQGISEYLDTLSNLVEVRPDCNVIITRCLARDFIKYAEPYDSTVTARYYEVASKSSKNTGYTSSTKLTDIVTSIKDTFIQGHAILGGINIRKSSTNNNTTNYSDLGANFKAGETPIENSYKVETFGTAVFYDDKLVGELDGMETICYLLTANNLKSSTISMSDPFNINSSLDLRLDVKKAPNINVEIINGSPVISVEVFLEGYGLSLDENTNYNSTESLNILNTYASEYMKLELQNYLYKTSKEFNSDISGFGKYALSKYKTWDEWLSSNWLENYKNSFFKVTVNMNIKSGYEFNKSP